ncbi:MAG TPA: biotin carboxylase N-terminal domain-containing protein [Kofleriaceae bacterium]|nr:biotin carboxylase N-terminal domain-containing protein [Kofleriaceae bacterium]
MAPALFHRIFIANRGEVAARVARTCDALGVTPVFGVSQADAEAPWVRGREAVLLGPARASESYLDPVKIVRAAADARCSALHPGWGFLSESPLLAALCRQHGVTFIGPPPDVMQLMGKKNPAKRAMAAAGLPLIPGSDGVLAGPDEAREVAARVGYPVLLKAESGGGGRGMRVAKGPGEIDAAYGDAAAEATAAFGDGRLYLEKLVEGGRHVEIQVLADRYGHAIHLGERDCTVQRNHQKLIEESPAPVLAPEERARALDAAVRAVVRIGYVGAGTIELLQDSGGTLRFMEMNTRLQVEHPVSEMRCGIDLVAEQIHVAAGRPLRLRQEDVRLEGHAIECRINAEDPSAGFRPAPGRITRWQPPAAAPDLRVDTHVDTGYEVPPHYDSLLCKIIARGPDRAGAIDRMLRALGEMVVEGVPTTISMHRAILASPAFREGRYDNRTIPGWSS